MTEPGSAAQLIRSFANTVDLEERSDELSTPERLGAWFASARLIERVSDVTEQELRAVLDLRTGIREALDADCAPSAHQLSVADAVLAGLPVRISLAPATVVPDPRLSVVDRALVRLGAAWLELVLTGQDQRLKRCAEHTCGWVFWDTSKNRSRRWCSMKVCGNRAKARRYAARRSA